MYYEEFFLLSFIGFTSISNAQNTEHTVKHCYNDNINNANINLLKPITVRVNAIVLYRDNGSGNFKLLGSDQESIEQSKVFMEFLDYTNYVYSNLVKPANYDNCGYNGTEFFSDMKIRITNNVIPIANTYYWNMRNGGTDLTANPRILGNFTPSSNWYLNPLDDIIHNSPNYPKAINSYFTSDALAHDSVVKIKGNYWPFDEVAGGEFPSFTDFNKSSRTHVPLRFLKYFFHKYKLAEQYNTTWEETRNWHINDARGYIAHELGHNFNLSHTSNLCYNNVMRSGGTGEGSAANFLTPTQIRTVHDNLTKTNLIQFVTEDSYYNAGLKITQDQTWNGKRRIYSDLIIESGANLTLKGDLIMPPQSVIYIYEMEEL
ncbi:hypothetical protein [Empedobacter tilapiae]|uniref:hypothetical protein n=1 Tax=Empedobacter tilapiae TaxID=2491114 RepID=UPI0028D1A756|nr:hypothetical protein [Empedobacter tilapiae]